MREYSLVVVCDTPQELMEALLNVYNRINNEPGIVHSMRVDEDSIQHFGGVPAWTLSRSE